MSGPRSNKEWIFWGRTDPLFGVATRPGKERESGSPWTRDEFLESGRRYFADVWRQWRQFGVTTSHCVEIGCGSARITTQLALVFDRVTALDVSPDQLARAAEMLGDRRDRVTLACVGQPEIPLPDACADAVFSCEVFQHFDSEAPFNDYMREASRVLRSGGTMCFQRPVRGIHAASLLASPVRTLALRLLRLLGRRRMMIYRRVDANQVMRTLASLGFTDIELRVFHVAEHDGVHAYFFARKP